MPKKSITTTQPFNQKSGLLNALVRVTKVVKHAPITNFANESFAPIDVNFIPLSGTAVSQQTVDCTTWYWGTQFVNLAHDQAQLKYFEIMQADLRVEHVNSILVALTLRLETGPTGEPHLHIVSLHRRDKLHSTKAPANDSQVVQSAKEKIRTLLATA